MKIILASTSSRRISLLRSLGIEFEVVEPRVEEKTVGDPVEVARRNALNKARSVARKVKQGLVIAADTVVAVNGRVLPKPRSVEEAKEFLRALAGRKHKVVTAVAVVDAATGREECEHVVSCVEFDELSDRDIELYVSSGEPMDKAGAYAIQGLAALFVKRIEGDFFAIVGFSLYLLRKLLLRFGVDVLELAVDSHAKTEKAQRRG